MLNTPHGDSMLLYYSRKYAVYNLTFYESVTQNVFCFTWGETDAKWRGSNEIATFLTKYLKNVDQRGITNVILYCDTCSGQNKNKNILAAINNFLRVSKHVGVVHINFLILGHTYMPIDSAHAVIERSEEANCVESLTVGYILWICPPALHSHCARPYLTYTIHTIVPIIPTNFDQDTTFSVINIVHNILTVRLNILPFFCDGGEIF